MVEHHWKNYLLTTTNEPTLQSHLSSHLSNISLFPYKPSVFNQ
jgi:hypothetical protein